MLCASTFYSCLLGAEPVKVCAAVVKCVWTHEALIVLTLGLSNKLSLSVLKADIRLFRPMSEDVCTHVQTPQQHSISAAVICFGVRKKLWSHVFRHSVMSLTTQGVCTHIGIYILLSWYLHADISGAGQYLQSFAEFKFMGFRCHDSRFFTISFFIL